MQHETSDAAVNRALSFSGCSDLASEAVRRRAIDASNRIQRALLEGSVTLPEPQALATREAPRGYQQRLARLDRLAEAALSVRPASPLDDLPESPVQTVLPGDAP